MQNTMPQKLILNIIGKKRWQFQGECGSVEEVVLLYLKSLGWRGYFTEHHDYFHLLRWLIGWPMYVGSDNNLIKKNKSILRKVYDKKGISLFYMGSDGYINRHDASFNDVIYEIDDFEMDRFEIKAKYLSDSLNLDLDINDIKDFLSAVGLPKIKEIIKSCFDQEELNFLKISSQIFDLIFDEECFVGLPLLDRIHQNDNECFKNELYIAGQAAEKIRSTELREQYLEVLEKAQIAQTIYSRRVEMFSVLDLQLWDDEGLGFAEVKAPNDTLKKHQTRALRLLSDSNYRAWKIEVLERC